MESIFLTFSHFVDFILSFPSPIIPVCSATNSIKDIAKAVLAEHNLKYLSQDQLGLTHITLLVQSCMLVIHCRVLTVQLLNTPK